MSIIYETKGNAKEYAELAANLYKGCSHGCEYCYAPKVTYKKKETFFGTPEPRKNVINLLIKDLKKLYDKQDDREILFCFTCDPYQPLDVELELTRYAIMCLINAERKFTILTKGGKRSERDFGLLQVAGNKCRYGVTLVFANDEHSKIYEPGAAPTSERIAYLRKAHELGIKTWVSLEPVWSQADVFDIIHRTHDFVDEYKIGKLNYHSHAKEINWKSLKEAIVDLCEFYNINYKLKNDLLNI